MVCINEKETCAIDVKATDWYRGMYSQSFPKRCWSPNGREIIFTSPCKSSIQSYILELGWFLIWLLPNFKVISWMAFLDSCQIHQLSLPEGCSGCVVLDVFEDLILLNGVSLTRPDQLFIGRINYSALNEAVSWKCLSNGTPLPTDFTLATDLLTFNLPDEMLYEVFIAFYPFSYLNHFLFELGRVLKNTKCLRFIHWL